MDNVSFTGSVSLGINLEENPNGVSLNFSDAASLGLRYEFLASEKTADPARSNTGVTASVFLMTSESHNLSAGAKFGCGSSRTNAGIIFGTSIPFKPEESARPLIGLEIHPFGWSLKKSLATGPDLIFINTPSEKSTAIYAGWRLEW